MKMETEKETKSEVKLWNEREGEGREGTHKSICLRCGFGLQLVKSSLISLFIHLI